MIRLTGGTWRGRLIKTPPGDSTRPTGGKVREALFNIFQGEVRGARFIDVCCGAGTIGLEALSRGAEHVVFLETNRKALSLLEHNLALLHAEHGRVTICPVPAETWAAGGAEGGDLLYCDPPYDSPVLAAVLPLLAQRGKVWPGGWLVAETRRTADLSGIATPGLMPAETRRYGDTALWLWQRPDDTTTED